METPNEVESDQKRKPSLKGTALPNGGLRQKQGTGGSGIVYEGHMYHRDSKQLAMPTIAHQFLSSTQQPRSLNRRDSTT